MDPMGMLEDHREILVLLWSFCRNEKKHLAKSFVQVGRRVSRGKALTGTTSRGPWWSCPSGFVLNWGIPFMAK
jgi:hypothetical protein